MPLSVQVAASASPGAQMLTASPSSTPAASTGGGESGERAFSSHLEAEKRGESGSAGEAQTKSADKPSEPTAKPATAGSASENSKPAESPEKAVPETAEKGNTGRGGDKEGQASPHSAAKLEAMANNKGLQNAPAGGLSELTLEAPFAAMGERVLRSEEHHV